MLPISLEHLIENDNSYFQLSLEAINEIESKNSANPSYLYVLLTDTGTLFSKVAKKITNQPYNHVSIILDKYWEEIYSYDLVNSNGLKGGLVKENLTVLKGASYSLYRIAITEEKYKDVTEVVKNMSNEINKTKYNHLGLINAIFDKEIFETNKETMICSQFVVEILKVSGLTFFNKKPSSTVKPYDIVKSRMLQFVRRGKINPRKIIPLT